MFEEHLGQVIAGLLSKENDSIVKVTKKTKLILFILYIAFPESQDGMTKNA